MFENTYVINYDFMKKIKKYMFPRWYKIYILTASILGAIVAGVGVKNKSTDTIIIGCVFCLTIISVYFSKRYVDRIRLINRVQETSGKREAEYKSVLNKQGIEIKNLDTKAKATIKYELFKRIAETDEEFVLFTKSNQFCVVSKKNFDEEMIQEFKKVITERCKNLKEIKFKSN
ncbi:MAG: YcxB family protein [Clostridiaceae bacterium]|nr:YcxB family protein [Clostridiaceae bacterium]